MNCLYSLQQMAQVISATYIGKDVPFQGLSIDSRTLQKGDCFLCIKGPQFDGHTFVKDAIQKGASAIITDHPLNSSVPEVVVSDTLKALCDLAHVWRLQFNIPVIAVTGSCGKTSTRNMIVTILSQKGSVVTSDHNYNNIYGLPLSLLKIREHHQFAVFELGTNSPGEIKAITLLCEPTIAAITNVRGVHLQGLQSIEGVNQEKSDIFLGLRDHGIAVINADEPFHFQWGGKIGHRERITFSSQKMKADVWADHIETQATGALFTVHTTLGEASIYIPLLGEHVVSNALVAITCALAAGAQLPEIQTALATMKPVPGRMEPILLKNGTLLIHDAYNGAAAAVESAIKMLSTYKGKRIFVMSHLVELGDYATEYHTQMGQWLKTYNIDHALLTGHETLLQATLATAGHLANYFPTQEDLMTRLLQLIGTETTVLIKGAHSARMDKIVDTLIQQVNHHAIIE